MSKQINLSPLEVAFNQAASRGFKTVRMKAEGGLTVSKLPTKQYATKSAELEAAIEYLNSAPTPEARHARKKELYTLAYSSGPGSCMAALDNLRNQSKGTK